MKAEGRPGKDKKPHYKRQKMNKDKSLERRAASTSSSPRSDFSQSDDSDEEMSECPAESCQQPEGDEVNKLSAGEMFCCPSLRWTLCLLQSQGQRADA